MKEAFFSILRSYYATSGFLKTLGVVFVWIFVAGVSVLEPVIFTKIISYIELYLKDGVFQSDKIISWIVFWWFFILWSIALSYFHRYFFVYKNNMKNYIETCKVFNEKILYMWFHEYVWKKQWSLYKIYDRGTQGQESFLYFFFGEALRTISSTTIIIIILFLTDIRMAFLVLALLPVMFFLALFFIHILWPKQRELNDSWDGMFWDIWNALNSFMLTKTLLLEKLFLRDMSGLLDRLLVKQNTLWKGWSLMHIYTWLLVMLARLLVLWFWVFFIKNGSLSFAELFLVFNYIGWIYFPLAALIDRTNEMVRHLTSVEKMYREFSSLTREDISQWKEMSKITGNIVFQNVFFSYNAERKILKNISFEVKSGEKIALVWNTGAGKSTIAHLLLRFWDYDSGQILLDGTPIHEIKKSSLRHHVWVVSQDTSLFNLSIEENLKFANPKATKKQIEEALKSAQAEFVFDFPAWIKTIIGERGLKLSGWEKQRIALARLFLKNPEILILDEATSALDTTTEKKVDLALKNLMKWKTSIIIAHRLSTIRHVDRIFVLEQGKVVEAWNYQELMEKKGRFFTLANPDKLILG